MRWLENGGFDDVQKLNKSKIHVIIEYFISSGCCYARYA
jgi:hypothetical protein